MKALILTGVAITSVALQACNALAPSYNFSAEISDCQARTDVNVILQGTFGKIQEKYTKFEKIREEVDGVKKPELISHFKVNRLVYGSTGIKDNKTGKRLAPQFMEIRAGDVSQDALGEKGIICYGGKPSKIKVIHLEK